MLEENLDDYIGNFDHYLNPSGGGPGDADSDP